MAIYRQGLKENIKNKLIRYTGRIELLDKFIQASIKLDNKLYKQAIEKRKKGYIPRGQSRKGSFSNTIQGKPIDIDNPVYNILRILSNTGNNKKAQKPKGKYYACRKLGHFARNYQSKNKINRTKEINIVQYIYIGDRQESSYLEESDINKPE